MPFPLYARRLRRIAAAAAAVLLSALTATPIAAPAEPLRFAVTIAASARSEPVTGRLYVAVSRDSSPTRSPIDQAGPTGAPIFGVSVEGRKPGEPMILDASAFGHPVQSLKDLPAGDYWVQPFVNVYTRFPRADGRTVWLHMDQWEGQNWKRSPGNLYGDPVRLTLDPASSGVVALTVDKVLPPVQVPPDTEYVRRIKIRSEILSRWWGRPISLGATVLLPKDYDRHPEVRYPVNYIQGHFSLAAPGGFGRGQAFDQYWLAPDTPRVIYVTLQHPSPYYDDSYGVNSENNGPYGDAIIQELVPEVERRFRVIREPWARLLSGGSTGGWIALAHQIFYPDFYGGTWASCPDSIDFRAHQIVNIYEDDNAYWLDRGWVQVDRPNQRRPDGSIVSMMKDENWYELAAGDRSRSGGQWDIWEATYSPVGADGYPKPIWNKRTGKIDKAVAAYWKTHYDLRAILERDWAVLGPKLANKINLYVGEDDSFYLDNAVHLMDEFLRRAANPPFGGEVVYQPGAPHCWGPRGAELLQKMVAHLEKTAPKGADVRSWRHK
jgi:hypothetical protein